MVESYRIVKVRGAFFAKDADKIKAGCCKDCKEPKVLKECDSLIDGIKELYRYSPKCKVFLTQHGRAFGIVECVLEVTTIDEDDGEILNHDVFVGRDYRINDEKSDIILS